MKTLTDHLTQYAAYHQDGRNVATHFVGIPMIVLAVATLLARPAMELSGWTLSPAVVLALATCVFYFRLDLRFGLVMGVVMAAMVAGGQWFAAQSTALWLAAGIGLFVVGWVIQFVGHYFEGKKPAFVDDLVGLVVGPLFLAAEAAFYMNLRTDVKAEIDRRLGAATNVNVGVAA
jgi:uncharacterized membrane protein YGL010W